MNDRTTKIQLLLVLVCALGVLGGCSKLKPKLDEVLPDKRTAYKKSKSLPDLEVPPDLTTEAIRDRMAIPQGGEAATFSSFQERQASRKKQQELERTQDSAIQVIENEHILAVQGAVTQIWPQLRSFWAEMGFDLELDDEELGVVETAWRENQEELTRNKFKVFAEAGQEPNTTVLYVSHRGEALVPKGEKLEWQPRPREVELERAVVERLRDSLGGADGGATLASELPAAGSSQPIQKNTSETGRVDENGERVETEYRHPEYEDKYALEDDGGPHAELVSAGSGKIYITLKEEFSKAWDSTQIALARAGVEVQQADKSRGVYSIRLANEAAQNKKNGWSKLKFWGKSENIYELSLTGVGRKTELVLLGPDGEWDTSETGAGLLRDVQSLLNQGS